MQCSDFLSCPLNVQHQLMAINNSTGILSHICSILACNSKLRTFLRYGQWWVPDCLDKRGSTVHGLWQATNI